MKLYNISMRIIIIITMIFAVLIQQNMVQILHYMIEKMNIIIKIYHYVQLIVFILIMI